jgi:hypothetical protein
MGSLNVYKLGLWYQLARSAPFTPIKTQFTGRLSQMQIYLALRDCTTSTVYTSRKDYFKSQITAGGGGGV